MSDDTDYLWNPRAPVDSQVAALEQALRPYRYEASIAPRRRAWRRWLQAPLVAAVLLVAGVTTLLLRPEKWSVRAEGTVTVSNTPVTPKTRLAPGEVLTTGTGSAATLTVGSIGELSLGPSTTLRLDAVDTRSHRLSLVRGEMHARIWALPRVFEVATAQARAVDLGCVYTLRVDERGVTSLEVFYGAVELVGAVARGTSYVPAGNAAQADTLGAGIPWPLDAPADYRSAAIALSSRADDSTALSTVLATSGRRSTITLWHLLPRVDETTRRRIVARLAQIAPPPAGVSAEGIVALDSASLRRWEDVLRPAWSTEAASPWRRFLIKWRLAKPRAVLLIPGGRS